LTRLHRRGILQQFYWTGEWHTDADGAAFHSPNDIELPCMPAWIDRAIPIVQIVLSVIVIGLILIQGKGSGLSTVFGGGGDVYSTKRGAEKIIFNVTIVVVILFFGVALFNAAR
jgi:preprotein translocase subunit SecG